VQPSMARGGPAGFVLGFVCVLDWPASVGRVESSVDCFLVDTGMTCLPLFSVPLAFAVVGLKAGDMQGMRDVWNIS